MIVPIKPMSPAAIRRLMRGGCLARDIEAAEHDRRIALAALRLLVRAGVMR